MRSGLTSRGRLLIKPPTSGRTRRARTIADAPALLRIVKRLPRRALETERLGQAWLGPEAELRDQKEHWIGWLEEYDGPGYYGRKNPGRSAEFIYNHLHCPPMLLWLAEAAGARKPVLRRAWAAVLAARTSLTSQSAALRSVLPWAEVERLLIDACCRRDGPEDDPF